MKEAVVIYWPSDGIAPMAMSEYAADARSNRFLFVRADIVKALLDRGEFDLLDRLLTNRGPFPLTVTR